MSLSGFINRYNIFHRVGQLEKASRVSSIEGRAFSESDRFRLERQFPLPYYNEIRYLAKRNTSLRTIIHVLQDKVFERTPVFIPVFEQKCTLCGMEYDADQDMCICGGILRVPAPEELTHVKEFFKNCNLNDQHFCTVLREFEDNLNIMDDGFLIVLKDYVFTEDNTTLLFEKVREILSVTPEFMAFDLDENLVQGNKHYTCVDHRQLLTEPGICPECSKPLFPVYFTYGEGSSQVMPYLKNEVIHNSRYSPSKTYGYSPIATVYEEAMIELNGNRLLNDTYMYQRPPKGILAIVTRNLESLQKFWKKEMDSVRTNPNHMPVMGIESETGRGKAEYISLMNSIADMDVLSVTDKMRESIAGLYRISPLYRGSTEGIGGLNAEDVQRAVTAEPVAAAQKGYHDEVFPKLLKMFGITDWKLEFPSPYPADDNADLDKRIKEVQVATQMHGMGFVVSLDENDEFVYSGESQQPEMGGFGDEMMLSAGTKGDKLVQFGLTKGKTYIDSPKDAPAGANVQRGPQGGYFYTDVEDSEQKPDISEFKQKLSGMDDSTLKSQIEIIENEYPEVEDGFQNWYDNSSMKILDGQLSALFGMSGDSSRAGKTDLDSKTAEGYLKIYAVTQEYLKRTEPSGKTIINRGLGPNSYQKYKNLESGEKINIKQYNISSWTNDYDISAEFAGLDPSGGVIIETYVPTNRIFIHPDISPGIASRYGEGEIVLMGSKIDATMAESFEPEYDDEEDEDE